MEKTNNIMMEKILYSINDFNKEMLKNFNYLREDISDIRGDIRELKKDVSDLRQELRDYKEENNKRWDENEKRWEENEKRWEKYEENRKKDKEQLLGILTNYDISISEQLGDPNASKMRKFV